MSNFHRLLTKILAIFVLSGPAAAQDDASGQGELPPPIRIETVTLEAPPEIDVPAHVRRNYLQYCKGKGHFLPLPADENGSIGRATFVATEGEPGTILICEDAYRAGDVMPVKDIDFALAALSARPFAALWGEMEAAWGDDLSLLREMLAQEARTARTNDTGLNYKGDYGVIFHRASLLQDLGYYDEALAMLREARARIDANEEGLASLDFERIMVENYIAILHDGSEGPAAAAASLEQPYKTLPHSSPVFINLAINYAAFLAEEGENARSLDIIRPLYRKFRQSSIGSSTYKIGGSDRQFAWIIACDYIKLGKPGMAQPFVEIVEHAVEVPADEYRASVTATNAIKRRMRICMGDEQGWKDAFGDRIPLALDTTWLLMQPGYHFSRRFPEDWQLPDALTQRFEDYFRVLPASYGPALRHWLDD